MPPLSPILDRRAVLQMIAAGAAASVTGCSPPNDKIYPYVNQPEGALPGSIRRYATAVPFAGYGRGVTGFVTDGRPIKLEGLEGHPASLGSTDLFTETALLDLFDPQRIKAPTSKGTPTNWSAIATALFERLNGTSGKGLAILTGRITSPTLLREFKVLQGRFPALRHVQWEPFNDDAILAGMEQAVGSRVLPRPKLEEADVVLCLGADPLGPGPEQVALARRWGIRRRQGSAPRLYAAEPSLSASGAMADRRVSVSQRELSLLVHHMAAAWVGPRDIPALPSGTSTFATLAAKDLVAARGRALVLAGADQPPSMHAFAAWANGFLAAPIEYFAPVASDVPHVESLAALSDAMHRDEIDTLVVIDANPVYSAPPALDFKRAIQRVPLSLTACTFPNETAAVSKWRVPLSHPLEEWNDWRASEGTTSIAQPLVRPFFDSRSAADIIALIGDPNAQPASWQRVRTTWSHLDDQSWAAAVATGAVPETAAAPVSVGKSRQILPEIPDAADVEVQIRASPALWDGSRSHNAWAQECPDPITKEVWGASARCHPADLAAWGIEDGGYVRVEGGGRSLALPARAASGQRQGVMTLLAGYGRSDSGPVANGIGGNAFTLAGERRVSVTPAPAGRGVITTQHLFALDAEFSKIFPIIAPGEVLPENKAQPSLLPNGSPVGAPSPQWAMVIDTDVCIGCNACVVACQAENNIPVIGPEEMAVGRDMHWLRIDRYELNEDGATGFQPVPCMHCEKAPCEPVCPVEASVHNDEGLNLQVYNRCIGTRTCEANCPYRVRRFNFFDYSSRSVWGEEDHDSVTAQRNPNVTVRGRGVMEKCTYCVQRIAQAEHDADAYQQPVGEVVTACQAACPTRAITFGSVAGAETAVSQKKRDPRHYALLGELGTKPRTTYLARTINRAQPPGDDEA